MYHIHILCIGSLKSSWLREGCQEYLDRLKRTVKVTITELPASKAKTAELQVKEESDRLCAAMEKYSGDVLVLDERGTRMSSREFADLISSARDRGDELVFVIGGAYGLNDTVRKAARGLLRLSDMTLTHEFSRALLLEQLYRAIEIERGSGYHH